MRHRNRDILLLKVVSIVMTILIVYNSLLEYDYYTTDNKVQIVHDSSQKTKDALPQPSIPLEDGRTSLSQHTTPVQPQQLSIFNDTGKYFIPPRTCNEIGEILTMAGAVHGIQLGFHNVDAMKHLLSTWKVMSSSTRSLVIVTRQPNIIDELRPKQMELAMFEDEIIYDVVYFPRSYLEASTFLRLKSINQQNTESPSNPIADFVYIDGIDACRQEIDANLIVTLLDNMQKGAWIIGDYFDITEDDVFNRGIDQTSNKSDVHQTKTTSTTSQPTTAVFNIEDGSGSPINGRPLPPPVIMPCSTTIDISRAATNLAFEVAGMQQLQVYATYADKGANRCWMIRKD